jgi:hypothetical protein
VKIYLGGVWDNHLSLRELFYIWNMSNNSGDRISSLDVSLLMEFRFGKKSQLTYQLAFPAVALVVRTSYTQREVIPQITTLNRFVRFKNSLGLEHTLSRLFDIRFKYQYIYYQYPDPQSVQSGMDHFIMEIVIKF